ncbi:MAG: hypothetical protein ACFCUN_03500 [Hyphomicrobiaceae bacterium]
MSVPDRRAEALSRRVGVVAHASHEPSLLKRFAGSRLGSTSIHFIVMFNIMLGVVALVLDFGLATTIKVRQQKALDAATLAASQELGLENAEERGREVASAFYEANTKRNPAGVEMDFAIDTAAGRIMSSAKTAVDTWLMKALGVTTLDVRSNTTVARANGTVEVALVLDNSGSMQPHMAQLREAAKQMSGILFVGTEGTDRVRVGLVPFAASVNVGSHHRSASWIDSSGLSPVHHENFESSARTRFQLFDDMGVGWGGCVEMRPQPHDVQLSVPTPSNPATLFVPMFAPDEPDTINADGKTYRNSYLVDDGGACTRQARWCVSYSRRGNCTEWYTEPLDPAVAQSRMCKYSGQTPAGSGPNLNCTTAALLPLTSTKGQIETAIDGMVASGWTNVQQGVMWGWRLLSPDPPFTEARPANDDNNRKYLVIMTDGENTYQRHSNQNLSMYGAFGYLSKARLSQSNPVSTMNSRTLAACENAKAAGITIFTVAFAEAAASSSARNLMRNCASGPGNALLATDGEGLKRAFEDIGREISQLRIAG